MIRTRDFILYLSCLVFVIIAAFYTGLLDMKERSLGLGYVFSFVSTQDETYQAQRPEQGFDRAARIDELRAKVASGDGSRDDVFASVHSPVVEVEPDPTEVEQLITNRIVHYCNTQAVSPVLARWPAAVVLQDVEGMRMGYVLQDTSSRVGATTSVETTQLILFEIPVRYSKNSFTTCVPDTLVGITPAGQPLLNETARQYYASGAQSLVGYSRDGFAIFGPDSSVVLDECGGATVGGLYRYHIRADEPFILGCYSHVPTPINFSI